MEPHDSRIPRAASLHASRRKGVITRTELRVLGLSRHTIDHWLRSARLHLMHRGVYLVGHRAAPPLAWEAAAVLACGPGAVISHRSAGHLWKLLPRPERTGARPHERPQRHEVDITVVGRSPKPRSGIRLHRVDGLDHRDIRRIEGIPVTSPARTLLDLAAGLTSRELEQALAQGHDRRLINRSVLVAILARYPRRHGSRQLRALIDADASPALTRSKAEERMLSLVRAADLPTPETNVRVGRYEVDFLWPAHNLVVEVDGFAFHSSRTAFERDRARDAHLTARGLRVIRVTWRQMLRTPEAVIALIARAL